MSEEPTHIERDACHDPAMTTPTIEQIPEGRGPGAEQYADTFAAVVGGSSVGADRMPCPALLTIGAPA